MSEATQLLCESLDRVLEDNLTSEVRDNSDGGGFSTELWNQLEESAWPSLLLPEEAGGAGADLATFTEVLKVAGRHALPLPLAETMLARAILHEAKLPIPSGPLGISIGPGAWKEGGTRQATHISGQNQPVRHAMHCTAIVIVTEEDSETGVFCVATSDLQVVNHLDIAGEPIDRIGANALNVTGARLAESMASSFFQKASLSRAALICGAMEQALGISVHYVKERVVFGRPLAKLQAIQQQLSEAAGEVAATSAITNAAARAMDKRDATLLLAAARARAADAAEKVAGIVHQVHGAMGFTREYELHWRTRRLWSWRDEYGCAFDWRVKLGQAYTGLSADSLWPALAAT